MVPRGRPLVIESCLALLDAFQFFHKRVPSALVDWTIGQQAFNACMILLLDGIDRESIEHIGRVEKAYMVFVEMDKAGMHQLTGLAMSRITDGLTCLRQQSETRKRSMNAEAISPMNVQQSHEGVAHNPFDWDMGQRLHDHGFLHEPVMGATGMFLLEDHGLQTSLQTGTSRSETEASPGHVRTPGVTAVSSSEQTSFKAGLMPHSTLMDPRRDSAHPIGYVTAHHPAPPMPVIPSHYHQLTHQHLAEMQPMPTFNHAEGWHANVQHTPPHQGLYPPPVAQAGAGAHRGSLHPQNPR